MVGSIYLSSSFRLELDDTTENRVVVILYVCNVSN